MYKEEIVMNHALSAIQLGLGILTDERGVPTREAVEFAAGLLGEDELMVPTVKKLRHDHGWPLRVAVAAVKEAKRQRDSRK